MSVLLAADRTMYGSGWFQSPLSILQSGRLAELLEAGALGTCSSFAGRMAIAAGPVTTGMKGRSRSVRGG